MRYRHALLALVVTPSGLACTSLLGDEFTIGSTASTPDLCLEGRLDCDGNPANGCETTALESREHCGACDTACQLPNATSVCMRGACLLDACMQGFGNCDGQAANGCEQPLTSLTHCGACGAPCTNPHGTTACNNGTCSPTCALGYADCDGNAANGCEGPLSSLTHCGACNAACQLPNATSLCMQGSCLLDACMQGFGDCDGQAANGCEQPLTSLTHCGACGAPCTNPHGTTACNNGTCSPTCALGYADCDGNAANGCETNTALDPMHCGSCGRACGATDVCDQGECLPASLCGGFKADCDGNGSGTDGNGCETNIAGDSSHCGGCNLSCAANQLCLGSCMACPSKALDCDKGTNGCETSENALNCGACGQKCGTDATCGCGTGVCSGGTIHWSENFSSNARGWMLEGEWELGPTSAGPPLTETWAWGSPDPAEDTTPTSDNGVVGTGLGKNYDYTRVHGLEYLTSPVIELPSNPDTMLLTFRHWLNVDDSAWTEVRVEVFNGSTWVTKWQNGNSLIESSSWSRMELDVKGESNPAFRVRFGFSLKITQAQYPWLMSGWNIDDVTLSSATCL